EPAIKSFDAGGQVIDTAIRVLRVRRTGNRRPSGAGRPGGRRGDRAGCRGGGEAGVNSPKHADHRPQFLLRGQTRSGGRRARLSAGGDGNHGDGGGRGLHRDLNLSGRRGRGKTGHEGRRV